MRFLLGFVVAALVVGCGPTGPARLFTVKWRKGDMLLCTGKMTQNASVKGKNGKKANMSSDMEFCFEGKVLDVDKDGVATLECRFTKYTMNMTTPGGVQKIDLLKELRKSSPRLVKNERNELLAEMMRGPFKMRVDKFFAAKIKGKGDFWQTFGGGQMGQAAFPPKPMRVGESFTRKFDFDIGRMMGGEGAFNMTVAVTLEAATDKTASWSLALKRFKMNFHAKGMKMRCKVPVYSGRMHWDARERLLKNSTQMTMVMTMNMMDTQIETTSVMDANITCKITPAK